MNACLQKTIWLKNLLNGPSWPLLVPFLFEDATIQHVIFFWESMHFGMLSCGSGVACAKSLPLSDNRSVFKLSLILASASWGHIPFFYHEGSGWRWFPRSWWMLHWNFGREYRLVLKDWSRGGISNRDMQEWLTSQVAWSLAVFRWPLCQDKHHFCLCMVFSR